MSGGKESGFRSRASGRPFANLWIGTSLGRLGDAICIVALVWVVFERTQSAEGVALIQFAYALLVPVGGLTAGWLLDRYRVVPLMVIDAGTRAAVPALVGVAVLADVAVVPVAVGASLWLGLTWMIAGAGLPTVIAGAMDPRGHPRANMVDALVYSLSTVAGPLIAGRLLDGPGAVAAFAAASLANAAYAVLLWAVQRDLVDRLPAGAVASLSRAAIASGFRYVARRRVLLALALMFASLNTIGALVSVALPIYATAVLGGEAQAYAWLLSARGAGDILGIIAGRSIGSRVGLGRGILVAVVVSGALWLPMAVIVTTLPALVVTFAIGFVFGSVSPWVQTMRMRIIEPEMRGRSFGAIRTITNSAAPIGALAAAVIVPFVGVPQVFALVALAWVGTGLVVASIREVRQG